MTLAHDPAADGLVILARHQTAGRGQHGRIWLAPPDSSVLLSVLLFPPPDLQRPAVLTAWAAVAVCRFVLDATGEETRIKWPNDVYLKEKKICGILIEQRRQGTGPGATVAGIGLNVGQPEAFFAAASLPLGASLFSQTGLKLSWEKAARDLIGTLDAEYARLERDGLAALESAWSRGLGLLGKTVVAEAGQRRLRGRLLELGFENVLLRTDDGDVAVQPEAIQQLRAE
mgnify:CR=1 FL=1